MDTKEITTDLENKLAEAKRIPGLREDLEKIQEYRGYNELWNGSAGLIDLHINIKMQGAAYIIDEHDWVEKGSGGIEMSVRVGFFKDGKSLKSDKIVYRHRVDPSYDDWSKWYSKITDFENGEERIRIKVSSSSAEGVFQFDKREDGYVFSEHSHKKKENK